jgi:hypothetical protein
MNFFFYALGWFCLYGAFANGTGRNVQPDRRLSSNILMVASALFSIAGVLASKLGQQ